MKRTRVLLVEDNQDYASLLAHAFEMHEIDVQLADGLDRGRGEVAGEYDIAFVDSPAEGGREGTVRPPASSRTSW